jgi:hypothetical protein
MVSVTVENGWERLPSGFDVEFRHSIPIQVSDNGKGLTIPESVLVEEITALGKLHVQLGEWQPGERADEHEARVFVSGKEFAEVLRRLARASAALFIDRFHKPVDAGAVDWDRLEYLSDFREALDHCGLASDDIDMDAYRDDYVETMHRETRRLAQSAESPLVEPE